MQQSARTRSKRIKPMSMVRMLNFRLNANKGNLEAPHFVRKRHSKERKGGKFEKFKKLYRLRKL